MPFLLIRGLCDGVSGDWIMSGSTITGLANSGHADTEYPCCCDIFPQTSSLLQSHTNGETIRQEQDERSPDHSNVKARQRK